MKWLPKDRQNPFIIVVLTTAAVLVLIYFFLIGTQHGLLSKIAANRLAAEKKLQDMDNTIKNADLTAKHLEVFKADLVHAEMDMASGDLYSWTYSTMRQFKSAYKVELPDIGAPKLGQVDLLPAFPYSQITFTISGKAYYHELGKFVADFENAFPHARLVNLNVTPVAGDTETLTFNVDVIALVKPNAS
jgi:Tfp pilus assembly protein PilO